MIESLGTQDLTTETVLLQDKTYSLIVRMRHNVIKTGLKKINLVCETCRIICFAGCIRSHSRAKKQREEWTHISTWCSQSDDFHFLQDFTA